MTCNSCMGICGCGSGATCYCEPRKVQEWCRHMIWDGSYYRFRNMLHTAGIVMFDSMNYCPSCGERRPS